MSAHPELVEGCGLCVLGGEMRVSQTIPITFSVRLAQHSDTTLQSVTAAVCIRV